MWFLLYKVFKIGVSQAKKHKAKKNADGTVPSTTDKTGTTTEMFSLDNASGINTSTRNPFKTILDILLRLLQFALGLAVVGLYGQDISGTSSDEGIDGRWLYAVIVGVLSSLSALLYLIHLGITKKKKTTPFYCAETGVVGICLFAWEGVVCLLWLICFGIFGKMFLATGHHAKGYEGKMWRAVWVDLVCWGVWGVSMVWFGVRWWKARAGGSDTSGNGDVEKGGDE